VYWAVLTACLYAFRAVALRDLGLWTAHMATSAWSLLWVVAGFAGDQTALILQAVGLSAPLIILAWLVARLEAVFGAAYAGTYGGLAQTVPRLSLLLVLSILAAVGTPLFPTFFTLLATITRALPVVPGAALIMLVVWLLWAWAGARMQRGMVVGPAAVKPGPDLDRPGSLVPAIALVFLAIAGATSLGYLV
jgi:NADH:ubiquinone oxidoreductase subunit 4 (subunit M)